MKDIGKNSASISMPLWVPYNLKEVVIHTKSLAHLHKYSNNENVLYLKRHSPIMNLTADKTTEKFKTEIDVKSEGKTSVKKSGILLKLLVLVLS